MDIQTITVPLIKLKPSPANVRKTNQRQGIEELAANIAALGLLQPPIVEAERDESGNETGCYLVVAGKRRRRALLLLVKGKRLKKNEGIVCTLKNGGSGGEVSLAENFYQCPMHPADQFEAFSRLATGEGLGIEDISAHFGVTPAIVKQRLRLAAVSPTLIERYRAGELNLDQLMAFALTDDHAAQERVFAELSWNKGADMIRKLLTKCNVPSSDRRAVFVGPEAYEAAGGRIIRDLFAEDNGGYLADSDLLDQLVLEKLGLVAEEVRREGWKWGEVYLEYPYGYSYTLQRLFPEPVTLSEEEEARVAALEATLAEVACLEDGIVGDKRGAEREAVEAELRSLTERHAYLSEDVARAGVLVSLDPAGAIRVERGFVKPEDESREEVEEQFPDHADGCDEPGSAAQPPAPSSPPPSEEDDGLKPHPDKLVVDLLAHRSVALEECIAANSEVALLALVHSLALRIFYRTAADLDCLGLKTDLPVFDAPGIGESRAGRAMTARHGNWQVWLPKDSSDLWTWLLDADSETRLNLLSYCVGRLVTAIRSPWEGRAQANPHADRLALAITLDMADWWEATKGGYFARVSKARILEAVREGVSPEAAERMRGMKKDVMAEEAETLLRGRRWLPAVFKVPDVERVRTS